MTHKTKINCTGSRPIIRMKCFGRRKKSSLSIKTDSLSSVCSNDKVTRCSKVVGAKKRPEIRVWEFQTFSFFVMLAFLNVGWAQDGAGGSGGVGDERCFLQAGGSTASFFVKEDLSVGNLVGQLRIKGDVGENINLTLTPSDGPLRIDNQDLILTKPLDKEGVEGPSSINVDITCHRLNTFDPGSATILNSKLRQVKGDKVVAKYKDWDLISLTS